MLIIEGVLFMSVLFREPGPLITPSDQVDGSIDLPRYRADRALAVKARFLGCCWKRSARKPHVLRQMRELGWPGGVSDVRSAEVPLAAFGCECSCGMPLTSSSDVAKGAEG